VTKFGIHYLRHYHASRCLENGMPMKELSAHMGHSGIAITMDIYAHIFEDVQAKRRRRAKVTGETIASE
jgi:integrase